jgi:DNA-binding protein HU-beta
MASRRDVSKILNEKYNMSKVLADQIVDDVFERIAELVSGGEIVQLRGFGSFQAVNRPARMGRNPATGEALKLAARTAMRFRKSKSLSL